MTNKLFAVNQLFFCVFIIVCSTEANAELGKPEESFEIFDDAKCCDTLENLQYDKLKCGAKIKFNLGEKLTKLKFKNKKGISLYKAIDITSDVEVHDFAISSYLFKDKATNERLGVIPIVAVLNEDFSVSRVSTSTLPFLNKKGGKDFVEVIVTVDSRLRPKERYIVIFTDESFIGNYFVYCAVPQATVSAISMGQDADINPCQANAKPIKVKALHDGNFKLKYYKSKSKFFRPFKELRWE